MYCLKCGGSCVTCSCGGAYCSKCHDEQDCARCCFCGELTHVGKDCPERKSKEPALGALLDQLFPG